MSKKINRIGSRGIHTIGADNINVNIDPNEAANFYKRLVDEKIAYNGLKLLKHKPLWSTGKSKIKF